MNKKKLYRFYFIYQITNKINNKVYIGWHATNDINDSYFGSGKYLKNAIQKYGKENFIKEIVEFCCPDNFCEKERYWIKEKNTLAPFGYNLTSGGEGSLNREVSKETLLKMKNSQLIKGNYEERWGKEKADEVKCKQRQKIMSEESKIRIGKAQEGNTHTLGLKMSDESKALISKSLLGNTRRKGFKTSEETKRLLSISSSKSRNLKEVECPHCHKKGKGGNMTRFHFDKCKSI